MKTFYINTKGWSDIVDIMGKIQKEIASPLRCVASYKIWVIPCFSH